MKLVKAAALALLTATAVFGEGEKTIYETVIEDAKEKKRDNMTQDANIIDVVNDHDCTGLECENVKDKVIDEKVDEILRMNQKEIPTTDSLEDDLENVGLKYPEYNTSEQQQVENDANRIVEEMKADKQNYIEYVGEEIKRLNQIKCSDDRDCEIKEKDINELNEELKRAIAREIPNVNEVQKMLEEVNEMDDIFDDLMVDSMVDDMTSNIFGDVMTDIMNFDQKMGEMSDMDDLMDNILADMMDEEAYNEAQMNAYFEEQTKNTEQVFEELFGPGAYEGVDFGETEKDTIQEKIDDVTEAVAKKTLEEEKQIRYEKINVLLNNILNFNDIDCSSSNCDIVVRDLISELIDKIREYNQQYKTVYDYGNDIEQLLTGSDNEAVSTTKQEAVNTVIKSIKDKKITEINELADILSYLNNKNCNGTEYCEYKKEAAIKEVVMEMKEINEIKLPTTDQLENAVEERNFVKTIDTEEKEDENEDKIAELKDKLGDVAKKVEDNRLMAQVNAQDLKISAIKEKVEKDFSIDVTNEQIEGYLKQYNEYSYIDAAKYINSQMNGDQENVSIYDEMSKDNRQTISNV